MIALPEIYFALNVAFRNIRNVLQLLRIILCHGLLMDPNLIAANRLWNSMLQQITKLLESQTATTLRLKICPHQIG